MQDVRNENATSLRAIEHDVFTVLQTPQTRTDVIAETT
jgi:hypothetical protein